jgi:hypothetical protein
MFDSVLIGAVIATFPGVTLVRKEAALRDAASHEGLAGAEARATSIVSEAIASGDIQADNFFIAQKHVEALGSFATGSSKKTLLLPVEATGILSSLAGITEVAREAFGKGKTPARGR